MIFFRKKQKKGEINTEIATRKTISESVPEQLTEEGKLPWGWLYKHRDFIDERHKEYSYFVNNWFDAENDSPKRRYETLKSLVLYLDDLKKLCYSKGECYAKWYDTMIVSPEELEIRKQKLGELTDNFHELQDEWEKRQRLLLNLDKKIWQAIKDNEGIIQADLLKMYDFCVKHDISSLLYNWDKEGRITRTKSGRSYKLSIRK